MAKVVYNTTFQLRRGTAEAWHKNNPILARGEPGYEIDTYRLKIGDGSTPWRELSYTAEGVFNAATANEFPSIGRGNVIYKAEAERTIYQWNTTTLRYEALSNSTGDFNLPIATTEVLGGVKSSEEMNGVVVDSEGKMAVHSLNINKLVQNEGDYLVLYGGSASDVLNL